MAYSGGTSPSRITVSGKHTSRYISIGCGLGSLFYLPVEYLPVVNILAIEKFRKYSLEAFLPSFTLLVDAKATPPLLQTLAAV